MPIERVTCRDRTDHGLDEVVASDARIHFERMSHNSVWFAVQCGEHIVNVWLNAKGTIKAHVEQSTISLPQGGSDEPAA